MNPFADRILPDPETRPAVSVQSYNRETLDIIVNRLLEGLKTRNNHTQASVIISTDPGTGKTHLLSRLIDAVTPHLLPVFIPPMNESRALGRAVLNRTVSRLCRILERGGARNQFQWLTLQLFSLSCAGYPEIAAEWKEFPIDQVKEPFFQQGLKERRREIETHLAGHLGNLPGKPLLESAATWTRALLDILSNDPGVEAQAIAWLKGRIGNYPGFDADSAREAESMDPYEEYEYSEGRLYDLTQLFDSAGPCFSFSTR